MIDLRLGDCLVVLPEYADDTFDSVVMDPPAGISFMGKEWDHDKGGRDAWVAWMTAVMGECLRVLKPGGHAFVWALPRTSHWTAWAIESAGFDVRDVVMHIFGSGFPKSLAVDKAIDKAAGAEREVIPSQWANKGRSMSGANGNDGWKRPSHEDYPAVRTDTAPATPDAARWQGWGTSLKPAGEMWILAHKPLTPFAYCAIMVQNLSRMEAELCKYIAGGAARNLEPIQAESSAVKIVSAQENAAIQQGEAVESETVTGLAGDICSKVVTSGSTSETANTALSTLSSWKNILADCLDLEKMSIISTDAETTIDWKILSYCLSQITLEDITQGALWQSGSSANASNAARYFSATVEKLKSIQELSALALAISKEHALSQSEQELRPAAEHWILARKPFAGTVAANVLTWGTGALNVDACRIPTNGDDPNKRRATGDNGGADSMFGVGNNKRPATLTSARWPANVTHDGSAEATAGFPVTTSGTPGMRTFTTDKTFKGIRPLGEVETGYGDTGSAARFFYAAKASKADRDEGCEGLEEQPSYMVENGSKTSGKDGVRYERTTQNRNPHPCVKNTALMRYLVRMITPPGGTVLDPFMGSGSTGKAAVLEGFDFVGIELDPEYIEIARRRIDAAKLPLLEAA